MLEQIVKRLMAKTRYLNVRSGQVLGRGASHQIDSYGVFEFVIPFVYPIRLLSEAKWESHPIGLPTVRGFLSVVVDISQNYFPRGNPLGPRYTECGALFSAKGFTRTAQRFAWAHGLFLFSFAGSRRMNPVLKDAERTIGTQDLESLKKDDLDDLAGRLSIPFGTAVGFLDHLYPVILLADRSLEFDPAEPDDTDRQPSETSATVSENETDLVFETQGFGTPLEFAVPVTIAKSMGHQLESEAEESKQPAFSFVDIPVRLKARKGYFRRIFRLRLGLNSDKRRELLYA